MRVFHRLSPLLLLAALAPAAQAITVEQIPSPRPSSWVVDLTSTLPPETRQEIDRLSDAVKAQTGAEMAVVVVDTTGGVPSRDFATRLFNRWGIGQRGKDNGLLVFAALDDHAAEIVLGNGIDDDPQVRESEAVMQGEMVPRFRGGDPAGALLQGAAACAKGILGADVSVQGSGVALPVQEAPHTPQRYVPPPPQPLASSAPSPDGTGSLPFLGLLGSIIAAAVIGVVLMLRPPRCQQCKQTMQKLSEDADDAYLESAEQTEERIGSVDYQIWFCAVCGERKKTRRSRLFSGYSDCPHCHARTLQSNQTTIMAATYDHGGEVRVDSQCVSCSYSNSRTYSTPLLTRSNSSSHGFRSSSSGSGFGGGRSSGRGASGRW